MSASGDEASLNFAVDAPANLSTSFYIMLGDNAYGYTSVANNPYLTNINGDIDVYSIKIDPGLNYSVLATGNVYPIYSGVIQANFVL